MAREVQSSLIMSLVDDVTGNARKVSGALKGLGRVVKESEAGGRRVTFGDRLDAAHTRMSAAIDKNNVALAGARMGLVDAVAGYHALKAAIWGPVQAAADFEDAMADVKKVVDFPTPESLKAFERDLMSMSERIAISADGLAAIAAAAGQAGIAGEDLLTFTETAAKIGVAFDISADQAGEAMAKLMTGLGMSLPEVTKLADAMNHLSNTQASSAAEVLDVVRRVGAQGKQFGFAAEEVAAFGSAMIASGAQSEVAATSFMNMGRALTRGGSATKRQSEAMKRLGLDAKEVARRMQEDATGTTLEVMRRLSELPAEMRASVSSDLFGDEARALGPLLTQLDLVEQSLGLVGDAADYSGSAFKEFEVRNKTFKNELVLLNNSLYRVKATIGAAIIPILRDLIEQVKPMIGAFADVTAANPRLVGALMAAAGGVVALRVALASLRYVGLLGKGGALSLIAGGLNLIGSSSRGLYGAAAANVALQSSLARMAGVRLGGFARLRSALAGMAYAVPGIGKLAVGLKAVVSAAVAISAPAWGVIAVGIGAVAAAGAAVYRYWDRISAFFRGVGAALAEELGPAIAGIMPDLTWLKNIARWIGDGWDWAKQKLSEFSGWFSGMFARETLTEGQKAEWESYGKDLTKRLIDQILKIPRMILDLHTDMVAAGAALIQGLWDGMAQLLDGLIAWVKEKADAIAAPFRDLGSTVKGWFGSGDTAAPAAPGQGGATASWGKRRSGGPVSAGKTYWVGEDGPEPFTPSRSGYIHPTGSGERSLAAMLEGLAGQAHAAASVRRSVEIASVNISPKLSFPRVGAADAEAIARRVIARIEQETSAMLRGVMADIGLKG